jgi:ATP synthase protein I
VNYFKISGFANRGHPNEREFRATTPVLNKARPAYRQVIAVQLLIAALAAVLCGVVRGVGGGSHSALSGAGSAFVGGLVCVVPSALFALRLWAAEKRGAEVVSSFVSGELIKLFATGLLMLIAFRYYPGLDHLSFMVGLIGALHGYFFALLIVR